MSSYYKRYWDSQFESVLFHEIKAIGLHRRTAVKKMLITTLLLGFLYEAKVLHTNIIQNLNSDFLQNENRGKANQVSGLIEEAVRFGVDGN